MLAMRASWIFLLVLQFSFLYSLKMPRKNRWMLIEKLLNAMELVNPEEELKMMYPGKSLEELGVEGAHIRCTSSILNSKKTVKDCGNSEISIRIEVYMLKNI